MRIMTIARFHCGCLYETEYSGRPPICPEHRRILTGIEHIRHTAESKPVIRGPNHQWGQKSRAQLPNPFNSKHNSLTLVTSVRGEGYEDELEAEPGMCDACYIENQMMTRTYTTMCGCPKIDCHYRWCGDTRGLHALFRMHVQRDFGELVLSEGENPDDIDPSDMVRRNRNFSRNMLSFGSAREWPEWDQTIMNAERKRIEETVRELAIIVQSGGNLLLSNLDWLQKQRPEGLKRRLTWLHCAGAPEVSVHSAGPVTNDAAQLRLI